jgi:hypothetical protein
MIKVNDFIIQAKVKEDVSGQSSDPESKKSPSAAGFVPDSIKQEIIDECMERVNELIDRKLKA